MTVIIFGHEKGGVGKSTLCTSYARRAIEEGLRVAVVDTDPQSSSFLWYKIRTQKGYEPHVSVLQNQTNKLQNIMELKRAYDVVIVDVGANDYDSLASFATIADLWIAPTKVGQADLASTVRLINAFEKAGRNHPRGKIPIGVVINQVPGPWNSSEHKDAAEMLRASCPAAHVFQNIIRDRRAWRDTGRTGVGVTETGDKKAIEEFENFFNESLAFMQATVSQGNKQ
jgi:chromosome partitioning protein